MEDKKLIKKPWGFETIEEVNSNYVIKHLVVYPNNKLSLQYHEVKQETLILLNGTGRMQVNDEVFIVTAGDIVKIPPKTIHRIIADNEELLFMEVSTPHLNDVVRLEDSYGRVK